MQSLLPVVSLATPTPACTGGTRPRAASHGLIVDPEAARRGIATGAGRRAAAFVVVPFGYAPATAHNDGLMAAGRVLSACG